MRIVIDTNVVVSGVFFGGPPLDVLQTWRDGVSHLVLSPEILDEYRRVGDELSAKHEGISLAPFLGLILSQAEIIEASSFSEQVCRDMDDDKFIECAVAGRCRFIISGDRDLLDVGEHEGVKIVTPREFLESPS